MTEDGRNIVRSCFADTDPDLSETDYVVVLDAYSASAAAAAAARRRRAVLRQTVTQIEARLRDNS